ncbi:unnamed protein product [Echinostoma caproni]|uniref:Uncharacterized protein n=1 Tax=Echinostoma caproni TaxID=27848 RepID=A0A3P8CZS2_9TREM|nr:unnamed protein product [Echinostoma caproni]
MSGLVSQTNTSTGTTSTSCPAGDTTGAGTAIGHVTVTRTGSGASGTSVMNLGLMEGKQRCCFKHLYLLKLHEIKRFDLDHNDIVIKSGAQQVFCIVLTIFKQMLLSKQLLSSSV